MKNKVSIIMPIFNSSLFLEAAINSVLSQSFTDWELIIVDDCSTDSSILIAQRFARIDPRIVVLCLDVNSGAAVARNTAINYCSGRYIAFLDSDDLWLSSKLDKQIHFMRSNDLAFTYTSYYKVDEKNVILASVLAPINTSYSSLLKTNVIGCLTVMYDTEKLGKVEMPLIRKRQDFGLWLQLLRTVDVAYGIQEPLARYRVRDNSVSANKLSAARYTWSLYRRIEKLSFASSVYYFTCYAVGGVLRSRFPKIARMLGYVC